MWELGSTGNPPGDYGLGYGGLDRYVRTGANAQEGRPQLAMIVASVRFGTICRMPGCRRGDPYNWDTESGRGTSATN